MTVWNDATYALITTNERNGYSIFGADFTPSPEAIAKVNEVFDYIEANPEKWSQDTYGNDESETNCFMGLICRLNGVDPGISYWGTKNDEYTLMPAMDILGMGSHEYSDRADYIALFIDDVLDIEADKYRMPTLDEMRERVSIALNHDFRNPKAFNDPTVGCCGRDVADCDC